MIHHCVFFTFRDDCDQGERDDILLRLARLEDRIPGLLSFSAGPNADFEQKSQEYGHGFVAVFVDREALALYATDPEHLGLGQRLVAGSVGGPDGVVVFDIVAD